MRSLPRRDRLGRAVGGLVLKAQTNPAGRRIISLHDGTRQQSYAIAPMVAAAFIGPKPDGTVVCHGDGDHRNDAVVNLRYDSQAGNCADKRKHGTHQEGGLVGTARLNAEQVRGIRAMRARGATQDRIARAFNVSRSTVGNVLRGSFWRHVT